MIGEMCKDHTLESLSCRNGSLACKANTPHVTDRVQLCWVSLLPPHQTSAIVFVFSQEHHVDFELWRQWVLQKSSSMLLGHR